MELDRASHTIKEAVDKALESAKKDLVDHPLELAIAQDLPPAKFDLNLIMNVLQQLLENAAKYSPTGPPIRISAERSGDEVSVSVADRGAGIDELEQALIFDKFYRGRGSRGLAQGTGMGLRSPRPCWMHMGGSIRVTSQLGHGSVFTISIPLGK
jgi:two-component system, OmpR family, sensor histidine kinase KdpD